MCESRDGGADAYHTLNRLQMATLAGAPLEEADVKTALEEVASPPWDPTTALLRPGAGAEGFWERVEAADLALTCFLLGEATELGALEHEYGRAFATRSSRRDRDSVVDHLRDIAEVHGGEDLAELAQRLDGRP